MDEEPLRNLIQLLLARLERISVDSYLAHRASGLRGALLMALDRLENGQPDSKFNLEKLTASAFGILKEAMKEKRGRKGTEH